MMLVDTSVRIDHFNGHASPEAMRLRKALADNEAIVSQGCGHLPALSQ